jgi:hypothetical protein
MSLYIPPPGGYPTGPESCDERDDCTPIISLSFASPPVVAYITACALCLTAAAAGVLRLGCKAKQLGHEVSGVLTQPLLAGGSGRGCEEEEDAVKRTLMVGRRGSVTTGAASPPKRAAATVRPKGGATPPAAIATPHSDTVVEELGSDRAPILRHFTGYRSVCTGSVAMAFVVGYSALLFSLYIVLAAWARCRVFLWQLPNFRILRPKLVRFLWSLVLLAGLGAGIVCLSAPTAELLSGTMFPTRGRLCPRGDSRRAPSLGRSQ